VLDVKSPKLYQEKTGKERLKFVTPFMDMKTANARVAEISKKYGLAVNPTDVIEEINVSTQQRVEILKMLYRDVGNSHF
jgi:ABC-type uncharacterized transport systems, ATPase components